VWDYGDEFGNDQDMCQSSNYITGITGCIVSTSICSSGKAKATKHVKPTSLSMSSSEIATYASNLNASKAAIKTQLPGLWEYTCVSQSSIDNESAAKQTEFEKISRFTSTGAELHVIGVYEAGSDHSFCHSTTGKVSVTVKNTGKPIILAVGSYEPVVWNIVLEQGAQLERVILSGYGVQKVTGISSSVPVSSYTYYSLDNVKKGTETGAGFFYDMRDPNSGVYYDWASQPGTCPKSAAVPVESRALLLGSSNYFYAYEAGGEGYSKLITKLKDITGVRPTSFQGAYQKTSFTVSSDSPAPVPAKENQDYYSQNSSFQAISVASIGSNSQVLGASTMCVNLTRNFHRGDESQDTKTLQTFLISNEYLDSDVSGFYGDKTVEAVKRYQRNKGLPETGMVYEFTRESIKRDSCN
jgi:hypothetical protein